MDEIEKVARAMVRAGVGELVWESWDAEMQEVFLRQARAAIEAVQADVRQAVERTIDYLSREFIVEECAEQSEEGCLSCEMIQARTSLRKVLHLFDEGPTA